MELVSWLISRRKWKWPNFRYYPGIITCIGVMITGRGKSGPVPLRPPRSHMEYPGIEHGTQEVRRLNYGMTYCICILFPSVSIHSALLCETSEFYRFSDVYFMATE
jgi:hypothetical protein